MNNHNLKCIKKLSISFMLFYSVLFYVMMYGMGEPLRLIILFFVFLTFNYFISASTILDKFRPKLGELTDGIKIELSLFILTLTLAIYSIYISLNFMGSEEYLVSWIIPSGIGQLSLFEFNLIILSLSWVFYVFGLSSKEDFNKNWLHSVLTLETIKNFGINLSILLGVLLMNAVLFIFIFFMFFLFSLG